jgi:two-component system response regulator HydG
LSILRRNGAKQAWDYQYLARIDIDKDGLLKTLDSGTIFLDEIGDISSRLQQSLLRFLQEGEIQPIGGISEEVNVRVIAATNRDLQKMCEEGKFRWDLYYRLMVADIHIPSLRERGPEESE